MVEDDRIEELVAQDQLSLVRKQERAFKELEERPPAFPPTFKFEPGTAEYDLKYVIFLLFFLLIEILIFLSHFRRRPAWCDRILYKSPKHAFKNVELHAEQTAYRSHPSYSISDHKPVTSEFTIRVSTFFFALYIFVTCYRFMHFIYSN